MFAGYSECAGKCVSACSAGFSLNGDCECACGESEISMWNFRYLNISSLYAGANPDNGYDISKEYVLEEKTK